MGNPSEFNLEKGGRIVFQPPLFHTSHGAYKGKSDPKRVAEIGRLLLPPPLPLPPFNTHPRSPGIGPIAHDCWTYWGHSGAPLFDRTGSIIALHSSWDDTSGRRLFSIIARRLQFLFV